MNRLSISESNVCHFGLMPRLAAIAFISICGSAARAVPPVDPAAGAGTTVSPASTTTVSTIPAPKLLDNAIKTDPNLAQAGFTTIDKFIKDNITRLTSEDTDAASVARADLVAGSASPSVKDTASVAFLGYYLSRLSNELQTVLAKNPSIRLKVNIGIIAARVSENVKAVVPPGIHLQSVVLTLMKDPCDAVAIWGTKAAAAVLTAPDQSSPTTAVLDQLIPTVEAHKLSGAVTDDAYLALADYKQPKVIATLIKLYELRVAAYKAGVPPEPVVDARGSTTLTVQVGMWSKLTPKEQTKVVNLIAEQLAGAAKAMAAAEQPDVVDALRLAITKTAQGVEVVAQGMNGGKGDKDLKDLANRVAKIGANATPAQVAAAVGPLVDAIHKAFPGQ